MRDGPAVARRVRSDDWRSRRWRGWRSTAGRSTRIGSAAWPSSRSWLQLVDVGLIAISPALYDEVHALYGTPVLRGFEVGLFAVIVFHAANGLRLLVIDLVDVGARTSERLLWLAIGLTILVTVPASVVILRPVIA